MVSDFFGKRTRRSASVCFQWRRATELQCADRHPVLDIQRGNGWYGNGKETEGGSFRGFLVFITVLKEMVFQSFEVQAYDYLVKPVDKKQLKDHGAPLCFHAERQRRQPAGAKEI
ncbi:hypothetical protein C823_007484 [Eubacterium plexicaudatum ASF492]|nr:hypothetical protein C823_007484 [Eubacterium plexicaudatum ASF492]